MKVSSVWVFPNGMVAVFGPDDKQIGELQGRFEDVKSKIEAQADDRTEFNGWFENGINGEGFGTSGYREAE